jgi:hypothetical protein
LPSAFVFNKISKYEAEIEDSVVSLISSSTGYMELAYEINGNACCSLIYLNVALKSTAKG